MQLTILVPSGDSVLVLEPEMGARCDESCFREYVKKESEQNNQV